MPWNVAAFPFIPILLGIAFIVAGRVTRGRQTNWQHAQGFISPSQWSFQMRRGQRYQWQGPDGVVRDGHGYASSWPKPDGTPITVLYDPHDPNRFRISSDATVGTIFLGLGWVFVVLGVLGLITLLALVAVLS